MFPGGVVSRVPFRALRAVSCSTRVSHRRALASRSSTVAAAMAEPAVPEKSAAAARPAVIFFDCDDCLYKNDWRVAKLLTAKIESFCSERLAMREGHAYELYKKYGTCLRGMQLENIIDEKVLEEYLEYSHDVPLHEHIAPDPALREMLQSLDPAVPKWVFTASTRSHATRCLELLGVLDMFEGIIDVRAVEWVTKHDEEAYRRAMAVAGLPASQRPETCLFLDDSTSNMKTAKAVGWQTVLVGRHARDSGEFIDCEHADHAVDTVHELEKIMPHLFVNARSPAGASE